MCRISTRQRNLTLNYGMRYEYYPFATRERWGGERNQPSINRVLIGGEGSTPRDAYPATISDQLFGVHCRRKPANGYSRRRSAGRQFRSDSAAFGRR